MVACKNQCLLFAFSSKCAAKVNFKIPNILKCSSLHTFVANFILFPAVKNFADWLQFGRARASYMHEVFGDIVSKYTLCLRKNVPLCITFLKS